MNCESRESHTRDTESEFITGGEYEIVHFRRRTVEEGEDVPSDRLDAGSLLDVARHLRVEPLRQIVTQIYLELSRETRDLIRRAASNCALMFYDRGRRSVSRRFGNSRLTRRGIVKETKARLYIFAQDDNTGICAPAYFIGILRDFQGDIGAGPGRAEYANPLAGVGLRCPVLVAVNASTAEAFDTWNMRNMTDSVMTVAQHDGVEGLRSLHFSLQRFVCHCP